MRAGADNITKAPAMSESEMEAALQAGRDAVARAQQALARLSPSSRSLSPSH